MLSWSGFSPIGSGAVYLVFALMETLARHGHRRFRSKSPRKRIMIAYASAAPRRVWNSAAFELFDRIVRGCYAMDAPGHYGSEDRFRSADYGRRLNCGVCGRVERYPEQCLFVRDPRSAGPRRRRPEPYAIALIRCPPAMGRRRPAPGVSVAPRRDNSDLYCERYGDAPTQAQRFADGHH